MKKTVLFILIAVLMLFLFGACNEKTTALTSTGETDGKVVYPAGTVVIYGTGQPQFLQVYYDAWLEKNRDIAPNVKIEIVQTKGAADSREKITMTYLSGAYEDLPDAVYIDAVNAIDLAKGGILKDETSFVNSVVEQFVDGTTEDVTVEGKIWALPDSVRPQVLFYNKEIFDKYDIDPRMMNTMDGYIEAGRQLKEKSNGKVYLSYVDPGNKTWRYWGRRGLMPQANARIWDDEGTVIIGSDEGTKRAFSVLDTLVQENLLLKTPIMEPALYDNMRKGEIATFYMGAFWDEFIRKNVPETSGQWRVMIAPVFEDIGTRGAPVPSYLAVLDKGTEGVYAGLVEKLWLDFHFENDSRIKWVKTMEAQSAPYSNPITKSMLQDPFWKEPSVFYGNTSFREMESLCLENGSVNLVVTPQDAQADEIISVELEKYLASDQTMEKSIQNMDKNLKDRIGKAEILSK